MYITWLTFGSVGCDTVVFLLAYCLVWFPDICTLLLVQFLVYLFWVFYLCNSSPYVWMWIGHIGSSLCWVLIDFHRNIVWLYLVFVATLSVFLFVCYLTHRAVSSANIRLFASVAALGRSLTYKRKSKRPRVEPRAPRLWCLSYQKSYHCSLFFVAYLAYKVVGKNANTHQT